MVENEIVAVQYNWWKSFALFPHRTVSGKWVWMEVVYKRVVWRYTGFTDEPFTEYGTMFDVIKGDI